MIKYKLIPQYEFHYSRHWRFSENGVMGMFLDGRALVYQWFIGPFRIDKWKVIKQKKGVRR